METFRQEEVRAHFDGLAERYDTLKERNWYYYRTLQEIYRSLIPRGEDVLDVGCGTGTILHALAPRYGLGIDISRGLIALARRKYAAEPHLAFEVGSVQELAASKEQRSFNYLILADVIEHVEDVPALINGLRHLSSPQGTVIISMANPLWEPVLLLLEKLKLKMPEGPHRRMPFPELEAILRRYGFTIAVRGYRLLVPAPIPFIADLVNRVFWRIPILRSLGLIGFIVAKRA